ncbi:hypothetical protein PRVXT_000268 [Proteinivorax tanatarense]|uniref:Zinc-ribbon domain-containing protein n=1 Tax=Proteinivorax tanatarense TaxID=1260629 RepID=A0AAU7VM00_9FIRM
MLCHNCNAEINDKAVICVHCGVNTEKKEPQVSYSSENKQPGGVGIAGFVLALISLFLPIPIIDIFIGFIALILSVVGMSNNRANRGLAIAGLVISIIAIIGSFFLWINLFSLFMYL